MRLLKVAESPSYGGFDNLNPSNSSLNRSAMATANSFSSKKSTSDFGNNSNFGQSSQRSSSNDSGGGFGTGMLAGAGATIGAAALGGAYLYNKYKEPIDWGMENKDLIKTVAGDVDTYAKIAPKVMKDNKVNWKGIQSLTQEEMDAVSKLAPDFKQSIQKAPQVAAWVNKVQPVLPVLNKIDVQDSNTILNSITGMSDDDYNTLIDSDLAKDTNMSGTLEWVKKSKPVIATMQQLGFSDPNKFGETGLDKTLAWVKKVQPVVPIFQKVDTTSGTTIAHSIANLSDEDYDTVINSDLAKDMGVTETLKTVKRFKSVAPTALNTVNSVAGVVEKFSETYNKTADTANNVKDVAIDTINNVKDGFIDTYKRDNYGDNFKKGVLTLFGMY